MILCHVLVVEDRVLCPFDVHFSVRGLLLVIDNGLGDHLGVYLVNVFLVSPDLDTFHNFRTDRPVLDIGRGAVVTLDGDGVDGLELDHHR